MRYLRRILELDYKKMFTMIKRVHKRSHKTYLFIIYDIFRCSRKFGSGYVDYCNFHFEELSDELKATYVTRMVNDEYCRVLNDPNSYDLVNDKPTFLRVYQKFAKRDYLDLRNATYDDYFEFIKKHQKFIVKPVDQLCGSGIEMVEINDNEKETFDKLIDNKQFLLEEIIVQDEKMASLNPSSINTIRVVTIVRNGNVYTPFIALRMGRKDVVVDNFNHGGLNALVNDRGVVYTAGVSKDEKEYEFHPDSNVKIKGFEIPHFDELIKVAKDVALVTPSLGMCGWDMCISKDKGVCVIEGNHLPGYDLYQCYGHRPDNKIGKKPIFDEIVYGNK